MAKNTKSGENCLSSDIVEIESDDSSVEVVAVVSSANDEDNYESENTTFVGSSQYRIVGLQHYDGKAHPGEYVNLVREPYNPYDRNAIRVDNLRGEKVGHIKRQSAELLARVMDHPDFNSIRIDASILENGCFYWSPVQLEFYCFHMNDAQKEIVLEQAQSFLSRTLKKDKNFQLASSQKQKLGNKSSPNFVSQKMLDWKTQSEELDKMFDQLCKDQIKSLPSIEMPFQYFQEGITLYHHQKQGIRWLVQQESSHNTDNPFFQKIKEKGKDGWLCNITNCFQTNDPKPLKGGILCDEMGMGKTIQTIGLILCAPPNGIIYPSGEEDNIQSNLISKRNLTCPTKSHKDGHCTLIVCPVSVMSNWQIQIENFVKRNVLNVELFHGPGRQKILPMLEEGIVDILVVSYNTLGVEYGTYKCENPEKKLTKKPKCSSIFDIQFHRIVLDEAHQIRSNKTKHHKAVMEIKAERRVALTGTPFINRAEDISSLLSFVNLDPLGDKDIFRRSITQPIQNGIDTEMGFTRLRLALAFAALRRSKVSQQIQLTEKIVELRIIEYPLENDVHKEVYDAFFGTIQIAVNAILSTSNNIDSKDKNSHRQYMSIFEKILRMRQCCCSAALIDLEHRKVALDVWKNLQCRKDNQLSVEEGFRLLEKLQGTFEQTKQLPECSICLEEFDEDLCKILRKCSHIFCSMCIDRFMDTKSNRDYSTPKSTYKCPLCRSSFEEDDIVNKSQVTKAVNKTKQTTTKSNADADNGTLKQIESPKILALMNSIDNEMKSEEKGVIFSQFTSFLDLIGEALSKKKESYVRLDGRMLPLKRKEAVSLFQNDEGGPRFILCSLHAAGTGINLTRGNFVFMMDCWWNEAVENQAMDRVHRIGQTRKVQVLRFVMKDTIEERMVELQRIKSLHAKGSMEKLSPEEKRSVRLNNLKSLLFLNEENVTHLNK